MPNLVTYRNQTPIFKWYVVSCGSKNEHPKRDWTMCSKQVNHSKLNNQHNWGNLYDHLMSTRIFTLVMNEIFIISSHNYNESGYGLALDLLPIHSKSRVAYPRRSELVRKSNHLKPIYVMDFQVTQMQTRKAYFSSHR